MLALATLIAFVASACAASPAMQAQAMPSSERYAATAGRHYGEHYRPFVGGGGSPTIALARHGHHERW
jgi:hypothetical protein